MPLLLCAWLGLLHPLAATAAPSSLAAAERGRRAFAAGLAALDAGELAVAEERFAEAAVLAPDWALAHLQLGVVRAMLDPAHPGALVPLARAVTLDPDNARAHLQLGLAYERAGRLDDAARELRLALERRGELDEARHTLAAVLAALGREAEAIESYEQVLGRVPGHLGALTGVAALYERAGRLTEAEAALVAVTRLYPAVPYHRYLLGRFYERIGAREKAREVFSRLEELDPRQRKLRELR